LQGIIARITAVGVVRNVAVAEIRTEELRGQNLVAVGGVDTGAEPVGAEGRRIEVFALDKVAAKSADIGHIEDRSEVDALLEAKAEIISLLNRPVGIEAHHVAGKIITLRALELVEIGVIDNRIILERGCAEVESVAEVINLVEVIKMPPPARMTVLPLPKRSQAKPRRGAVLMPPV
jgi:hypothetical protein